MKPTQAAEPLPRPFAPLLDGPDTAWLGRLALPLVGLAWLLSRRFQIFQTAPNQDVIRYFEVARAWLGGAIPYLQFELEYPPGTLPLFALALQLTSPWLAFAQTFFLLMLAFDLGTVVLLWRLPALMAAADGCPPPAGRDPMQAVLPLIYVLATAALGPLLLERYDGVCAFLLTAWFSACLRQRWRWADAALAALIWLKLIGVLLIPIYGAYVVASSCPPEERSRSTWRRWAPLLARRAAFGAALTGLLFAPFIWQSGAALLEFVRFHGRRGLQVESLFASLLLALHSLGLGDAAPRFMPSFHCSEVVGKGVEASLKAIPPLAIASWAGLSLLWSRRLGRAPTASARHEVLHDAGLSLLVAFMLFNKVFSPQYLLWLAPWVAALACRQRASARSHLVGFAAAWLCTALIFAFYYVDLLRREPMGVLLLVARNAFLLAVLTTLVHPAALARAQLRTLGRRLAHPRWASVALVLAGAWTFLANLSETTANDLWIQMRVGEDILRTGAFPSVETYSATVAGRPFIAHEWLSSVIFALLTRAFGSAGLCLLTAACALACFVLLWAAFPRARRERLFFLPLLLVTLHLVGFRMLARPHIFSLVASAAIVCALERWRQRGGMRPLLALVPMQLLWINLHGGALFGPALFAGLAAGVAFLALVKPLQGSADQARLTLRGAGELAATSALLALACLANPYGMRLIGFSVDLLNNTYIKERVWEWTTPLRRQNGEYYWVKIYAGALLGLWAGLGLRLASRPWIDLALATLMSYLSLRANRFVADFAIFAFPSLLRSADFVAARLLAPARQLRQPWLELGGLALMLANLLVYGYAHGPREHRPLPGWGFGGDMPYQEVALLKRLDVKGVIFNEYSDGALIIHELAPRLRPVLDSRIDLYPLQTVYEYDLAFHDPGAFERFIQRYRVNAVLLFRNHMSPAINDYLVRRPEWRPLIAGRDRLLFVRAAEGFSRLSLRAPKIGKPVAQR